MPEEEEYCPMPVQRLKLRKATIKLNNRQKDIITHTKQKSLLSKIDEFGEIGSPYYKSHMEILSPLKPQISVVEST